MTPELIEAAAKLCGWERGRNSLGRVWFRDVADAPAELCAAVGVIESWISPRGLLALEDALGDADWVWDKVGDEGGTLCYRWRQWFPFAERRTVADERLHPDRATAACLAAQAELEGK